jgi:prophage endopeptidase
MTLTAEQVKWIAIVVTAAAIFGTGCAAGFGLRGVIANAAESKLREQHSLELKAISDTAAKAAADALATQKNLENRVASLDAAHTEERERAQAEIDRLSADIRAGSRRLSVVAKCPAGSRGLPGNSGSSGMDHGAERAELDPAAADRIVRIATDGDAAIRQLTACQAFIKAIAR